MPLYIFVPSSDLDKLQGKHSEIDVIENMGEPHNASWSNTIMSDKFPL